MSESFAVGWILSYLVSVFIPTVLYNRKKRIDETFFFFIGLAICFGLLYGIGWIWLFA